MTDVITSGAEVCVVGAGVIGLSSAICIQTLLPEIKVTLIADSFWKQTTSDGAAGIFVPTLERVPGIEKTTLRDWCKESFQHYYSLANSSDSYHTGCLPITGYNLYRSKPKDVFFKDIVPTCRPLNQGELLQFGGQHKFGYFIHTVLVECRRYLPWLMARFKALGGKVINAQILDLSEVVRRYSLVVNCAGLGSRTLVPDSDVYPLRGQLLRVRAPWIKMFYRDLDTATSIIPGADEVVLAGTRQKDDFSTQLRDEDRNSVLDRCTKLLPQVQTAEVVREWVGLRPCRNPGPRLELETTSDGGKIIHNYGHGGVGVALAWGTGMEVARMVGKEIGARIHQRSSGRPKSKL